MSDTIHMEILHIWFLYTSSFTQFFTLCSECVFIYVLLFLPLYCKSCVFYCSHNFLTAFSFCCCYFTYIFFLSRSCGFIFLNHYQFFYIHVSHVELVVLCTHVIFFTWLIYYHMVIFHVSFIFTFIYLFFLHN